MTFSITLPWPPSVLAPNARAHWRKKDKSRRAYKSECFLLAKQNRPHFGEGYIPLEIVFHPPTRRGFDLDNALASIKAGIDGIAEAWGVNDQMFRPISIDFGDVKKNGEVEIRI